VRREADGALRAAGGRVLNVCALGRDLAEARARAYAAVDRIDWPGASTAATSAGGRWAAQPESLSPLLTPCRLGGEG
jgi:hypothetical protein